MSKWNSFLSTHIAQIQIRLICLSVNPPDKFMVHVLSFLPYQINYQNLKIKTTACTQGSSRLPSGLLLQPFHLALVPPSYLKDHKMLLFFSLKCAARFSETQTPRFHTPPPRPTESKSVSTSLRKRLCSWLESEVPNCFPVNEATT